MLPSSAETKENDRELKRIENWREEKVGLGCSKQIQIRVRPVDDQKLNKREEERESRVWL